MTHLNLSDVSLGVLFSEKEIPVLRDTTFTFPVGTFAIVAESRFEVVALIDMITRVILPQAGQVNYRGVVSWPIGHLTPFSVATTGMNAVSHLSNLYDYDRREALDFLIAEFEAPALLSTRMGAWPRLLRTKFHLLMALVVPFDIYVVDGNLVVPEDPDFTRRFLYMFLKRTRGKTVLMTVRQARLIQNMCQGAIVLQYMTLRYTEDLDEALRINNRKPHIQSEPEEVVEMQQDNDLLF